MSSGGQALGLSPALPALIYRLCSPRPSLGQRGRLCCLPCPPVLGLGTCWYGCLWRRSFSLGIRDGEGARRVSRTSPRIWIRGMGDCTEVRATLASLQTLGCCQPREGACAAGWHSSEMVVLAVAHLRSQHTHSYFYSPETLCSQGHGLAKVLGWIRLTRTASS